MSTRAFLDSFVLFVLLFKSYHGICVLSSGLVVTSFIGIQQIILQHLQFSKTTSVLKMKQEVELYKFCPKICVQEIHTFVIYFH